MSSGCLDNQISHCSDLSGQTYADGEDIGVTRAPSAKTVEGNVHDCTSRMGWRNVLRSMLRQLNENMDFVGPIRQSEVLG